jgi:hypothetical protein
MGAAEVQRTRANNEVRVKKGFIAASGQHFDDIASLGLDEADAWNGVRPGNKIHGTRRIAMHITASILTPSTAIFAVAEVA